MEARLRVSLGHGTVDDARYDIISLLGRRVTLVNLIMPFVAGMSPVAVPFRHGIHA